MNRVAATYNGKRNTKFDSTTIASRISRIFAFVTIRYTKLRKDIGKHIDKLLGQIGQLQNMGSTFDDRVAIGLLVASTDVNELKPTVAAIQKLSERTVSWESVSARIIEQVTNIKYGNRNRANTATKGCDIFGKTNITSDICF